MTHDPIVDEVRKARDAYAASFGYDVRAIAADLRRQQREEGRHGVSLPRKPAQVSKPPRHRKSA